MKEFQKIIKYVAIAFGIYLAITIISIIVGVIGAIFTGIYGVQMITEQTSIERIDEELVFSEISKLEVEVKTRYSSKTAKAKIIEVEDKIKVTFEEPQRAITPGQSAVFYVGDIVLGGGKIQ